MIVIVSYPTTHLGKPPVGFPPLPSPSWVICCIPQGHRATLYRLISRLLFKPCNIDDNFQIIFTRQTDRHTFISRCGLVSGIEQNFAKITDRQTDSHFKIWPCIWHRAKVCKNTLRHDPKSKWNESKILCYI